MPLASTPALPAKPIHYPTAAERSADRWVHVVGLSAAAVGGLVLTGLSIGFGTWTQVLAIGVYAACLIATFLCSAAYNLASPRRQPLLRRFDHAAIFLMIAGSYTPFTTQRLHGPLAIWMTGAVWATAIGGAFGKLFLPGLSNRIWIVVYLAMGWLAIVAIKPLLAATSIISFVLLIAGGVVYSTGALVYVRKQLAYRRALWHGFVVAAAATHYAAILTGVVLFGAR
ncbi:hemolysin III family protein [Caulobacter sp. S45]|uniref:PAQR family membrane homeostasis protein TrhA n=1 Tax=Caulobacter sp. S45 TaxID=1641861 RepID=UPI00131DA49D|nr:hemolysin III family protein [Caulobacter sp. S45]